jgi:two-component system chemotaxis sensor kinase CheA
MSDEQDEMIREFLVESFENLDRMDQELLVLEKEPGNVDVLNSVFRTIHTVKGTCGFFAFENLESLSHVGENLLDTLRSGKKKLTPDIINVLLKMSDAIREMLKLIESSGNSGEDQYEDLKCLLHHHNSSVASVPQPELSLEEQFNAIVKEREEALRQEELKEASQDSHKVEEEEVLKQEVSQPVVSKKAGANNTNVPDESTRSGDSHSLQDSSIRVDVQLLDSLMNLVGELVLARNQLRQITATNQDQLFLSTFQSLNIITTELQEGVMKTRMQPIHSVWGKFPRVVRDVAQQCNKRVRLIMEGKETELDKTIIEAIKDPLVHIVRNAIDHGIELPKDRMAAGKDPEGTLTLSAYHEGGFVMIEIRDDGGGLRVDRIKGKAVERGLITEQRAQGMSDQEAFKLIFQPGFSTAEQVTNLSGRGVGMDVVRTNIEKIGGALEVDSELGKGTRLKIRIPLTLAIVPALIVSCETEAYAIPQVSLIELVRLEEELFATDLEEIKGATFYRLRGNLLPLVYLCEELRVNMVRPQHRVNANGKPRVINIVVVRADTHVFGLIVDEVHDTEEIVVKSLSKSIKSLGVYAGATIMGDGRVALILDVMNLAQRAHIIAESSGAQSENGRDGGTGQFKNNEVPLLIVELDGNEYAAVPLDLVRRLEEFDSSKIETLNGKCVVQYRAGILDLVDIRGHGGFHNHHHDQGGESCQVIVLNNENKQVGFIVKGIVDVVKHPIDDSMVAARHGSKGATIIQDKIMDVLDLNMLVM